jgi:hypothetical protein
MALLLLIGAASVPLSSRLMASSDGNAALRSNPQHATLKPAAATSPDIPFTDYDLQAEQLLLDLANQARAQAGAPPLKLDAGLSRAARAHAETMFAARQLSHQFDGEPSLPQRLAAATQTQLDQEGENVALDFDAADGHKHLMLPLRIAPTCSTRPITWSGWVWFGAETGCTSCRTSATPSPVIPPRK